MLNVTNVHNMFPNIDNKKGISTLKSILYSRSLSKPSTACVIEALEIC